MPFYHVANPTIPGEIVGEPFVDGELAGYVKIIFCQKVGFSGNPDRFAMDWICNTKLLYKTPRLAFENSWEAQKYSYFKMKWKSFITLIRKIVKSPIYNGTERKDGYNA